MTNKFGTIVVVAVLAVIMGSFSFLSGQSIVTVNEWKLSGMLGAYCDSANTRNFWADSGYQTFDQFGGSHQLDNGYILTTHWRKEFWEEYPSVPDTLKWDYKFVSGHNSIKNMSVGFAIQDSNTYIWEQRKSLNLNGDWDMKSWDMSWVKESMSNFGRIYLTVVIRTHEAEYTGASIGVKNLRGLNADGSVVVYDYHDRPVSVNDPSFLPETASLSQNYPNPFNPSTKIRYSLTERSIVSLKVYNTIGQEVAVLVSEEKESGNYEVDFNASNLPSGVYVYRLTAGNYTVANKMILVK
ncbi:MAG TPA: T9SS type A sorting domain-containing protein [Candidatus Paceibacterota bacterium]|nr:T9SS type A sorting domain-containing protein [Candidatus Paceibacterota bacterium]